MKTEEEALLLEAYKASLNELDSNCKIKINGLTMVADENKDHAIAIAACIENQLKTVPKQWKLPVLYLIDSICKNFPKSMYVQLFTQNIVSNFCNVFEVSDEKVRKSLHKLRMTWSKTKIFPQKKLNAIDERVHEMDPNWPVLHKITGNSSSQQQAASIIKQQQQIDARNNAHLANLIKLPSHLRQPQAQPQPQSQPNQQHFVPNNHVASLPLQAQQPPPTQILPILVNNQPTPFNQPQANNHMMDHCQTNWIPPNLTTQVQGVFAPVASVVGPPQPTEIHIQPLPLQTQPPQPPPLPHLATQPLELNQMNILDSLYGGKQCSNCSLRFDDNNRYAIHLDWHFRQNLKSDTTFARRKWYYPLNLWVQFREINDDDPQDSDNLINDVDESLLPVKDNEVPTASASKDDEKNICSVCHETFEKFWAEEEEEWRLKNAKLHEDERVYHPLCLMDMLQTSKFDT